MNQKYHLITFGCQMNKSDSERIAAILEKAGYDPSPNEKEADLILVNACSVRQSAIDKIFGLAENLNRLKTRNPNLKTVLTGCLLEEDKKKFRDRFEYVVDVKDLPILFQMNETRQDYFDIIPHYKSSFTAFVPIMTGCNNFCTYCAVPHTRGKEVSRPADKILLEIESLVNKGFKEIWLLGQNVNSYSSIPFHRLLRNVSDLPGNFWIRFTSSHPKDFSQEMLDAITDCNKVTEYLNLPAQSGDDKILKKMGRPYSIAQYKNLVAKIKNRIPEIALSTDVIVGFPGETDENFNNTAKLFEDIKYDMGYISQYSPRPGTPAAKLKNDVSKPEKDSREKILNEILRKTALENNQKFIGKTLQVLAEREKEGFIFGKTRTNKTVKFQAPFEAVGNFAMVSIIDAMPWGLTAKIIE